MRTILFPRDIDAQVLELWEEQYVQYAWLGCLRYTTDRMKTNEMLTYVLVVAYLIVDMLKISKSSPEGYHDMIKVIDILLEVVGQDYRSDLIPQERH